MAESENAESLSWSLSEVVKRTSVSAGLVQQALKEGYIAATTKRKYDPAQTLVGLIKFLNKRVGTLPTYDSMAQCAAETGIPLGLIKQVRRMSRQAFRNTRISLQVLLKEIFTAKGEVDYAALEIKCKALLAQIELEKAQGLKLDKGEVSIAIRIAISGFWSAYERAAELELPPLLKGCDEEAIRRHLVEAGNKMKATFDAQLAKYACGGNGDNHPKPPKPNP